MDNKKPFISVIVPVYCAEKYLEECINSILAQELKNYELILVDDGSPDRSGIICDKFLSEDVANRVKVIHNKNHGVSHARNCGMKIASGKWVLFIDADDIVSVSYLKNMSSQLSKLQEDNAIVISGTKRIKRKNRKEQWRISFKNQIIKLPFLDQHSLTQLDELLVYGTIWGKLFNLDVIKTFNIEFRTELSLNEDHLFYFEYLSHVSTIITCNTIDYLYMSDDTAISLSTTYQHPYTQRIIAYQLLCNSYHKLLSDWGIDKQKLNKTSSFVYGIMISALKSCYAQGVSYEDRLALIKQLDRQSIMQHYRPNTVNGKLFKFTLFFPPQIIDLILKHFMK